LDFILFETVSFVVWFLFILGFLDRVFFLLSMIIGFFFSAQAISDQYFVLNQVYNTVTSSWVLYEINVYPYILLMAIPVLASFIVFIVRVLPNAEADILF
jgi:hypothetical protein